MARPSDEFLMAWSSLSGTDIEPGWRVISLPSAGPLELRAGRRSPDDAEAVLVGFPSIHLAQADKLPEGQGFVVERTDPEGNGQLWLALTHKSASTELFAVMVCDVVGALDDAVATGASEAKLARVFIGRVGAWQEFMRKGTQALSPEAELGLIGEIMVLRAIMGAGVPSALAIESWVGPLDRIQDFQLGTGALEVKSTLSSAGFPTKIGSLEQLDDSLRQPLFVAGARLRQTDSGQNLPEFVEAMRLIIKGDAESERLLTERLLAAGYIDAHADRYPRRFEAVGMRVVEVTNDFPRLTHGNIPAGIIKAIYEMDLDKAPGEDMGIEGALKKMGVI
ncbi:PD-(D/E)XK motif protein [Verminephrobacter eiseniae]|uniref:PD-(D/E)XK motif protein n=1 Tax=Verminephrobacter eiseniae TaxID=364317 RepID=UPI002237BBE4|nr:PD-(D/E)XK motif protein [Verminephrobacter eiseniae]MCW5235131.1 PD-(D/E)XK motif protein [Verminephrobacter eiseniae]